MLSVIAINLIIATSLTGRVSYFTIILQYINIPDWTGENFSANQRPGRPSYLSDRPENINLVEYVWMLLLGFVEFCLAISEEKSNMYESIRDQGGKLYSRAMKTQHKMFINISGIY